MNRPSKLSILGSAALVAACGTPAEDRLSPPADRTLEPTAVGNDLCRDCHQREYELWRGSHHDLAMQEASVETVLGDFSGTTVTHFGVTSTFYRNGEHYFVRTDGPDGELADFDIAFTFGVEPLQQYLIELPGGWLQALSLCWDTRPLEEGGQRWFHLYPDEAIPHHDPLHWTAPSQNWNYMCSECHSTGVRKGYRLEADVYATTYDEIDVACEACHGNGSRHVAWAESAGSAGVDPTGDPELVVRLRDRDDPSWRLDPETGIARRHPPRSRHQQVETCGRCHSRRSQLAESPVSARPLVDSHRPALLTADLYHADGQILEEVYVYGSFLQSRMFHAGVTCSDCHDPHSLEVASGNAVCAGCHLVEKFDTPEHHHHPPESAGARCVECHMPASTYMVIDPRRDHSLRVPRPDLSRVLGTPNACSDCHRDRPAEWAAAAAEEWYGKAKGRHYGEELHVARQGGLDARPALRSLIDDPEAPALVRATAFSLLGRHPAWADPETLERGLRDSDPLVRSAALGAAEGLEPELRSQLVAPLLADATLLVRIDAARALATVPGSLFPAERRADLELALGEYRAVQELNADRPEALLNLGWLAVQRDDLATAEATYRLAIDRTPEYGAAYANLADLYRERGDDEAGERVLRQGLDLRPDDGDLHHALGLLEVRRGKLGEAVASLERASELRPGDPRYAFVYAVALDSTGEGRLALDVLEAAHARHPADRELLFALATISRDRGEVDAAVGWANRLLELEPEDPAARQLLAQLTSR